MNKEKLHPKWSKQAKPQQPKQNWKVIMKEHILKIHFFSLYIIHFFLAVQTLKLKEWEIILEVPVCGSNKMQIKNWILKIKVAGFELIKEKKYC